MYGALSEDIGHAFFEGGCEHNELTAAMEGHTGTGSSNAAAAGSDNSINVLTNASNMGNSINSSNITGLINEANCKDDNLIESFAVFGGAFLMRPIGGTYPAANKTHSLFRVRPSLFYVPFWGY